MEDLATDRIYRLMIAQRMKHSGAVEILDEAGAAVRHTPEFIQQLFDEELDRLLRETANEQCRRSRQLCARRAALSEEMIRRGEFNPV